MSSDPQTPMDKVLHALGCIQAAHGCLMGSTITNAGICSDYLADAARTLKELVKTGELAA